jgi:arylsulfatase A-like enzyme
MMTRASLVLALVPLVLPMAIASDAAAAPAKGRMNVLFIAVDDLKPILGCYGDTRVKSPHIDRLAGGGVAFQRAYCQQAVCAPSRNSLLTGLRPDTIGIYDLATFFRKQVPDVVTLPQQFKKHGYHVEGMGKIYHTGHGNQDDKASWSVPSWRPRGGQYVLAENNALKKKIHAEAKKKTPGKRSGLPNAAPTECADVPDDAYADGKIAARAVERLRALKEKPFFLAVGFLKPHLPFNAPKRYWDLYDRASFKPPAADAGPPKDAPSFARSTWGELRKYHGVPPSGPLPADQAVTLIHGYHACVSYVDAQVGRLLDALDRLGLAERTVVILWGDHGWHLGDHGFWCKHTNYEQAARAPLILRAPGRRAAGARPDALVEFVDIYPTLCDLCEVPKPGTLEGTSMVPLLDDPKRPWERAAFHVYPRYVTGHGRGMGRAVRTDRYRLVEWTVPGKDVCIRELYDYRQDPGETANLAGKAEHAETEKELSELLRAGWKAALPPER